MVVLILGATNFVTACGGGGATGGGSTVTTTTGGGGGGGNPELNPAPSAMPTVATNAWNDPGIPSQLLVKTTVGARSRSVADSDQFEPVAASDGGDGAWCAWFDNRNGDPARDVFVGAFDANFAHRAGFEDGVAAFPGAGGKRELPGVATFQDGSVLVVAQDFRYGSRTAISANRVVRSGSSPSYPIGPTGVLASVVDYQNTAGISSGPLFDAAQFREQVTPLVAVTADNVGVIAYQEAGSSPGLGVSLLTVTGQVTVIRLRNGACRPSALVAGANGGAYLAWDEGGDSFAAFVTSSGAFVVWPLANGDGTALFPRLAALPNGDVAAGWADSRESSVPKPFGAVYGPDGTVRWQGKVSDTPCHYDKGVDVAGHPGNGVSFVWEGGASEAVYSRRVSSAGTPAAERTLTNLTGSRALPRALGEGNNFHGLWTIPGSVGYNSFDQNGAGSHGSNPLKFATPAGQHKIRGFAIPGSPSGRFVAVFQQEVDGHQKVAGRMPSRQP